MEHPVRDLLKKPTIKNKKFLMSSFRLGFAFAVAAIDVIKINFAPPVVSSI